MKHIVSFSGGKDSTALVLWAKENLESFDTVYCDTGWESPLTYEYLRYIDTTILNVKLIYLKSDKYDGFFDLCAKKGRAPSAMARFCTEELKVIPMKKYLQSIDGERIVYQGIRKDESFARSKMQQEGYDDYYQCVIKRPLFHWTAMETFEIMQKHGIEPNPLYRLGARRVGCYPCIMVNHKELKEIIKRSPEVIDNIRRIELETGRTFFAPNYIPQWAMTSNDPASGKPICFIDDVVTYLQDNPDQQELFEQDDACMSYYGLCGI